MSKESQQYAALLQQAEKTTSRKDAIWLIHMADKIRTNKK